MQAHTQIENPGDIDVTMTITMSLRSWQKLSAQLAAIDKAWQSPAADLRVKINRVARSMEEKILLKDDE